METNNIEELARIASGLKLADDYEAALAAQPENIRSSTRMQKIIAFLKDNGSATLKDVAMALYGRPDTASVNQLVKALKQAGIITDTGLVAPKMVKTTINAPGVKGRPKVTNDEIKMLGGGALRKFAKGETDFTPEEIDFITQLYNAATAVTESELAEVSAEESINENKKIKNNLIEARFQFLAGVINESEFKQLKEEQSDSFDPIALGDEKFNAIDPVAPDWRDGELYDTVLEGYFEDYDIEDADSFYDEYENYDMNNNFAYDIARMGGLKEEDLTALINNNELNIYCNALASLFILEYAKDTGIIEDDDQYKQEHQKADVNVDKTEQILKAKYNM